MGMACVDMTCGCGEGGTGRVERYSTYVFSRFSSGTSQTGCT
jgi:hypothetical protein